MVTINDPEPDYIVCKEMTYNFKNCAEGRGMNLNIKNKGKMQGMFFETSILITSNAIPNQASYQGRIHELETELRNLIMHKQNQQINQNQNRNHSQNQNGT